MRVGLFWASVVKRPLAKLANFRFGLLRDQHKRTISGSVQSPQTKVMKENSYLFYPYMFFKPNFTGATRSDQGLKHGTAVA